MEEVQGLRNEKLPTIPSTLLQEQMTNVFMRVSYSPCLVKHILCKTEGDDYDSDVREMMILEESATKEQAEHIVLLGYLRQLKDKWKSKL